MVYERIGRTRLVVRWRLWKRARTPQSTNVLRGLTNVMFLSVGLMAGAVALLALPLPGTPWLPAVVMLVSIGYFGVQFGPIFFLGSIGRMKDDQSAIANSLALQRAGHQHYLEAIQRISDREKPLYSETLEVVVTIGSDDDGDRVVERRITTPEPMVTHRTMRPIISTDTDRPVRLDEISFQVSRAGGTITALPLEQTRLLRVWLIFDPAISTPTEWRVEYRPPALWRPYRERGWDQLVWEDRLPTASGTPSAFTRFVVRFDFPETELPPSVKERQGYGQLAEAVRDSRGRWEVVWRDERPAGRRYVWDLVRPDSR